MIEWLAGGMAVASAGLAYNNARDEAERNNAVADARIAGIREQRRHDRSLFELQTFSQWRDAESAGTMRIARQMSMGAKGGTYGLNQMDVFRVRRDEWLGRKVERFKDRQAEKNIGELKDSKVNPARAGTAAGLSAGIETVTAFIPFF